MSTLASAANTAVRIRIARADFFVRQEECAKKSRVVQILRCVVDMLATYKGVFASMYVIAKEIVRVDTNVKMGHASNQASAQTHLLVVGMLVIFSVVFVT